MNNQTKYIRKIKQFLNLRSITAFVILFIFFYLPIGVVLGEFPSPVPYFIRKGFQTRTAHADDTGVASSGTSSCGSLSINSVTYSDNWAWILTGTPGNGSVDDDKFIQQTTNRWDSSVGDGCEFSNFGFALPNATVDGVVVEIISFYTLNGPARWVDGQLMTATSVYCGTDQVTTTDWSNGNPGPGGYLTPFGGSGNDWGCTLTQVETNVSGFGVAMGPDATANNTEASIDHVRMTVFYTEVLVPIFIQNNFRFYVNNGALTPTDAWGNPDLGEKSVLAAIPVSNDPPTTGDELRIRFNIRVDAATLNFSLQAFNLKYVAGTDCPNIASTSYSSVGASTSGDIWRFGDQNNQISDQTTLTTLKLGDSITLAAYVESNPTVTNPNKVLPGNPMEWDFIIENNNAPAAVTYCFRLQKSDDTDLDTYNNDSFPKIDTAPGTANFLRHGNFFSGEQEKGFFWAD